MKAKVRHFGAYLLAIRTQSNAIFALTCANDQWNSLLHASLIQSGIHWPIRCSVTRVWIRPLKVIRHIW